jgi:membrane associated rhomboid family serine protease
MRASGLGRLVVGRKIRGHDVTLVASILFLVQFHITDPAYTGSERARARFRLAVKIAVGFVALIWLIDSLQWAVDQEPDPFGIRPRQLAGLPGVLFAPLVHSGFAHLVANTPPLVVVGAAMLFLYPSSALRVLPAVYLGPGIAVWILGRDSVHFGASGVVYGLVAYVLVAGLLRRDRRAVAASLAVYFMYGSLVLGLGPTQPGVSWETHLAAALIGVALAIALRRLDVPPRKRYVWEGEANSMLVGNPESPMNEETLNLSMRKFLEMVDVGSQREIERALATAIAAGVIAGTETLGATMTLEIPALGISVKFSGDITLD